MKKTGIIAGAGDFNEVACRELIREKKRENILLLAADAGIQHFFHMQEKEPVGEKYLPDWIIGDFDSIHQECWEKIKNYGLAEKVIQLPREKDDTDILAALHLGMKEGCQEFHLFGGTGGRLDHTIANIQCLTYLAELGNRGYLHGKEELLTVIRDETVTFPEGSHGIISVFCLGDEAQGVTLKGLKYPLQDYTMKKTVPIGVSNEFMGKEASVTVKRGILLIVLQI